MMSNDKSIYKCDYVFFCVNMSLLELFVRMGCRFPDPAHDFVPSGMRKLLSAQTPMLTPNYRVCNHF